MNAFLLNYRAMPHASTGVSPAMLHLGREIRTKVPQLDVPISGVLKNTIGEAQKADGKKKQKMASYTDVKRRAKTSNIKVGDTVLLRQHKKNKLSTAYDPRPYKVTGRRGPSLLLQRHNQSPIMRNASHVHRECCLHFAYTY